MRLCQILPRCARLHAAPQRAATRLLALLGTLLGLLGPAHAARLALVIGNDQYQNVSSLKNARNDARLMAQTLGAAGFEVVGNVRENLAGKAMWRAIDQFKARIAKGDEVVFFYAGHGVQIGGNPVLLPVDIEAESDEQVEREGVRLYELQDKFKDARFTLMVIDACRDNPFPPKPGRTRSIGDTRGLAAPAEAVDGTAIIMAASRGQKALDSVPGVTASNGLFTYELVQTLKTPGMDAVSALRQVRDRVEDKAKRANHAQRPALVDETRGQFVLFPTGSRPVLVATATPEPVNSTPQPSQAGRTSLDDLEHEEATRRQWAQWQAQMKADYDKTAAFSGSADLQVKAWDRFLAAWPQDNPLSREDDELRAQATARRDRARQAAATPQAPTVTTAATGQVIKDCADCPELVVLPRGSFQMGSPAGEQGRYDDEGPVHQVQIDYRLAVGRYGVSRGEFGRFVQATGYKTEAEQGDGCFAWTGQKWEKSSSSNWRSPGFAQEDSHPVVCVSWNDAQAYVRWLNQKVPGKGYRLLSEAEREYAARAGSATRYPWGDDANNSEQCQYADGADSQAKQQVPGASGWTVANCNDGYAYTAPGNAFRPNGFGLYNMQGNAWEWVQDVWHDNYSGAPADGSAWTTGGDQARRVLRGGSWVSGPGNLRSAIRDRKPPAYRDDDTGFRLARTF